MKGARLLGGRYTLQDQIGLGGMAVVWRARDEVLGRPVAVKLLAGKHAGEPDARDRIRAEARAAAALSHPNIAQVYDYGEARERGVPMPYVVMEFVRGGTLQDRMDAGPMSPRFAMRTAAEVAAALAAAHADGLVHRDIKPANVMLTPAGVKVVDFGIAAAISPGGAGDEESEVLGTPAYLAPERLIGDSVEPASDVYALGVLLYRMLSGYSPWSADTTTQMLTAHVYIDPQPLPAQPDVPEYVTALCNRCLSKDPTQRPSAREVAALLAQGAGLRVVADAVPAGPGSDSESSVLIRPRSGAADPVAAAITDPGPVRPIAVAAEPVAAPMVGGSRRRGKVVLLLVVVAVVVVLIAAGLAQWLIGRDTNRAGRQPAAPVFRNAPASAGSPSVGPSAGQPAVPLGSASPGGSARAPADGGVPARTPARPGAPPAGATPATTTKAPGAAAPTRTTTAPAAQPPAPREKTFTSAGGSVRATCPSLSTAELVEWSAIKPYKVNSVDEGPGSSAAVTFKHGYRRVTMTVTCSGGVPSERH